MKSDNKSNEKNKRTKREAKPIPMISKDNFPIVGIGASAGGLEAFIQVFSEMPVDTDVAFVLVQHLDPTHPSMSVDILSRYTKLTVEEVKNGTRIEPNHIYVIPPNFNMGVQKRILNLSRREVMSGQNMTIDFFFQSLARSEKNRAIGIVLSGTGTDGTEGLLAIKAQGGVTCAQDPESAKYPGMPRNAINAEAADLVLRPESIATELSKIVNEPYIAHSGASSPKRLQKNRHPVNSSRLTYDRSLTNEHLKRLFSLLRSREKIDFSGYKQSTIKRRIQRRMMVQKTKSLKDYVKYAETHDEEVHALYNDILIKVTEFFRDAESFKELTKYVFPNLLKNKPKGSSIRIWVPGCSTGEEVYSIAISLLEFLNKHKKQHLIQIFATDVSEDAIQKARIGQYSESAVRNLSKERLKHFFHKVERGYQIQNSVRDLCLFSRHDLTNDPPFAKLDLVSCRNVMIYFGPSLQRRVIPIFHYALSSDGFLWLGRSENLGEHSQLFSQVVGANKLYSRSNVSTPLINFSSRRLPTLSGMAKPSVSLLSKTEREFVKDADNIILSKFSPPGVIVDTHLNILQFRGRTAPFLEPGSGQPSLNLLKMARPELLATLRTAIRSAKREKKSVKRDRQHFEVDGKDLHFNLEVIPINAKSSDMEKTFLVLFENRTIVESVRREKRPIGKRNASTKGDVDKDQRISELMTKLSEINEYHKSLVEQYETTQGELTSANEELQSANEELQSTNEEIETAKEELQSTNEELVTVNEELQMRNSDLTSLSDDLNNLLASIEIPVLIVGSDYRVRRFSPKAKSAFNLIPTDIGRPVGDISPRFDINLTHLIREVTETLSQKQVEVQDLTGRWLRLQVRPYKTITNKIDGAVVTLTDIDDLKKREERTTEAYVQADKANLAKDEFLAALSHELRTPLSSILTWAQLIAHGKVDSDKVKQGALVIEQNAKTQSQLIDDLLDISRIIVGKLAIEIQSINPASVIRMAIESVRSMAEKKSIQINTDLPNSTELIHADSTRLQQIIWNILTNAIKFSPKRSTVKVELRYTQEGGKRFAKIRVFDCGSGIPPEFLPHIFDRFSQADGTSTRVHGGLGLGLAIVRSLVELQSGTVKAENAQDGKGAVFTVTFPVISQQSAITHVMTDRAEVASTDRDEDLKDYSPKLDGLRILIVDDDETTREAIGIFLKSYGAQIKIVGSAAEALEVFSRFRPSLLLSDLAMPGEDGFSLIRKIRSFTIENGGDIPAMALSAYTDKEHAQAALNAGFQTYVTKPVEARELARLILKLI